MLSRNQIKTYVIADLANQFSRPVTDFNESDNLRTRWSFDEDSLRQWGEDLNDAPWFSGVIAPSEIIACQTIGSVIDLLFGAQGRPKQQPGAPSSGGS
jgi:hypothetical protein